MPKKKTYRSREQLELALERAKNEIDRRRRMHDQGVELHADSTKAWGESIRRHKAKLEAETLRADNLDSKVQHLDDLSWSEKVNTLKERAEAAETNLVAFRTVSLGLLDLAKRAGQSST
jgi:hypothetical protein